jgi:hypothetical protein
MEAICLSRGAIYCDTDSLICKSLPGLALDKIALGAWDLEAEMTSVLIAGKKLYAYNTIAEKVVIKSKGVRGVSWNDLKALVEGGEMIVSAFAPTLTKTGSQRYIDRTIRATAKVR